MNLMTRGNQTRHQLLSNRSRRSCPGITPLAGRVAPGPAVVGLLNPVPAQRARLLLAQGEVAAAARWVEERGLGPDDDPGYPREPEYLVLARVLLAQDRPGPALTLLGRLHTAAAAQNRAGSIIEIQALQALALAAAGDDNAAVNTLAQALMLGCPQGYVRISRTGEGSSGSSSPFTAPPARAYENAPLLCATNRRTPTA